MDQLKVIKQVYEDGMAEINGREYKFTKTTHKKRLKVFAFMSSIQKEMKEGNMSFLDTPQWESIELVISAMITIDDVALNKAEGHFEKYPADYLKLFTTAMAVISLPLSDESVTD